MALFKRNPAYTAPTFTLTADAPKGHPLPELAHVGDAGYDLTSTEAVYLAPGGRAPATCGVTVELDPRTVGLVCPRSGLARDTGLTVLNAPGIVDSGYTGELVVMLVNTGHKAVHVPAGTRVAQFVAVPVVATAGARARDERGASGFGSSGGTGGVRVKADLPEHTGLTSGSKAEVARQARADAAKAAAEHKRVTVDAPKHYTTHPVFTGQCHGIATHMSFDRGNAFKYLWRCAAKGNMRDNLGKARWYLDAYAPANGVVGNVHDKAPVLGSARLERALDEFYAETDRTKLPLKTQAAVAAYTAAAFIAKGNARQARNYLDLADRYLDDHDAVHTVLG